MTFRRKLVLAMIVGVFAPAHAQSPGDYHMYFTEAFSRYGEAVEACESRRETSHPPSEEVISKVEQYEVHKVRVFLMYNDFKRMQECSSDAAVEILVAIGSLPNVEGLLEETRQAVKALEETLFIGTDLAFEMKYRELPKAMRSDLEQLDYFQAPFAAYAVLDEIEALRK